MKTPSKWCTGRHPDRDVTCERKRHTDDDGPHRAEYGPPVVVQTDNGPAWSAQVVSWV